MITKQEIFNFINRNNIKDYQENLCEQFILKNIRGSEEFERLIINTFNNNHIEVMKADYNFGKIRIDLCTKQDIFFKTLLSLKNSTRYDISEVIKKYLDVIINNSTYWSLERYELPNGNERLKEMHMLYVIKSCSNFFEDFNNKLSKEESRKSLSLDERNQLIDIRLSILKMKSAINKHHSTDLIEKISKNEKGIIPKLKDKRDKDFILKSIEHIKGLIRNDKSIPKKTKHFNDFFKNISDNQKTILQKEFTGISGKELSIFISECFKRGILKIKHHDKNGYSLSNFLDNFYNNKTYNSVSKYLDQNYQYYGDEKDIIELKQKLDSYIS